MLRIAPARLFGGLSAPLIIRSGAQAPSLLHSLRSGAHHAPSLFRVFYRTLGSQGSGYPVSVMEFPSETKVSVEPDPLRGSYSINVISLCKLWGEPAASLPSPQTPHLHQVLVTCNGGTLLIKLFKKFSSVQD